MNTALKIFIVTFLIGILYIILIPGRIPAFHEHSDAWQYISTAKDLHNTEIRPMGFPILLRIAFLTHDWYLTLRLMQVFMCSVIFVIIYKITTRIDIIVLLLLSGAYITRITFIMADLTFCLFFISSYYFLKEKKLLWHFIFLSLASITKPNLAWFFIIEPFIVYYHFRSVSISIYSFILCFLATSVMPIKNYFEYGEFFHSRIMDYTLENDWHKTPLRNLFAHAFSTHWNYTFHAFGLYKRDMFDGVQQLRYSLFVLIVNYVFYGYYAFLWVRFLLKRNFEKFILVAYFLAPTILICPTGGRYRLLIEFLLY